MYCQIFHVISDYCAASSVMLRHLRLHLSHQGQGMNAHIMLVIIILPCFSMFLYATRSQMLSCLYGRIGTYRYRILCLSHKGASAFDTLCHVATTYLFTDGTSQKGTLLALVPICHISSAHNIMHLWRAHTGTSMIPHQLLMIDV